MDKNEGQFVRISIIFPMQNLEDVVPLEKELKAALSKLKEYRWDFQVLERKGDADRGLDKPDGMS